MRRSRYWALVLTLAAPAAADAQSEPPAGGRYVPAPWWMREPVIAATGQVHINLPANRAQFSATFSEVDGDSARALAAAARRSAALDAQLQAFGASKLQFTRTFVTVPLYRQYRDAAGNRVDNRRADEIENYQVTSTITISVQDVSVIEQVYAAVTAAQPSSVTTITWTLQPDDATVTALSITASHDATRRARESAEAAGARLGPARIIDPSGSVCATEVLTGWPGFRPGEQSRDVTDDAAFDNARGRGRADRLQGVPTTAAPPPPPPPPAPPPPGTAASEQVTLRPPMQRLADRACIIFSLL